MARHKQHKKFSSPQSALLIFKLRRDRVRKLLAMVDDIEFIRACWVLDRGSDPFFEKPLGYDYPQKFLRAGIDGEGRVWPWELETLLVEALGTRKRPGRRNANPRAWNFWTELVSALRNAENAEGGSKPVRPIFRRINRVLYRQFQWQARQQNLAGILRWKSIFSDSTLSDLYQKRYGITPITFQLIGLAFNYLLDRDWQTTITNETLSDEISNSDIRIFIELTSRNVEQLRDACRPIVTGSGLVYRESPLRRTPLVRISETPVRLMRPLNSPLFWRITEGLYYDVVDIPASRNLIGAGFESFQRRLLAAAYPEASISGDQPYDSPRLNKRSPDITLVKDRNLKITFECKAKKITLTDKISIDHDILESVSINEIAKGIFQLARFRKDLRSGKVEGMQESEHSQYVILTLDDWNFTGPISKDAAFKRASEMLDRKGVIIDFDLRDITFCTAADLDLFVTRLDLDVLQGLFAKNRQPQFREYAPYALAQELYDKPAKWRDYPLAAEF